MAKSFEAIKRIVARAKRFGRANEAIAAVEFALILPFMLILYMGSVELSQAVTVDRKVAVVAGALGDLVARQKDTLPQTTLDDFFAAAQGTMRPYNTTALKQAVTSVYVDVDGAATVQWSTGFNGAAAHTDSAAYSLPTEITDLVSDGCVIVAEAQYQYLPLMGYFFEEPFVMYKEFFYLPRYGECIADPS
ncbi:MAG: TadE/TadG family type IV pilus assembly protein [Cucumibacter sp.]